MSVSDPSEHASTTAILVLQIAGRPGPSFPLDPDEDNVLGRGSGSLVALADRLASRNHAAIRFDRPSGGWMLVDLGSRNGTWLDGVRVTRARLADGSLVRIGATDFVFRPTAGRDEPAATAAGRVIRRGKPAELEGAALQRANRDDAARWPMLLYQAGLRLLAAAGPQDVIGTTLELAAEFTAGSSFAWLEIDAAGGPAETICVVPPGSGLQAAVAAGPWADAVAGRAVWLATDGPAGDVACVPLPEEGRIRAVLAAGGAIRDIDFEFLLALASLAAAACAGREGKATAGHAAGGEPATTAPFGDDDESDGEPGAFEGTLALSAADLRQLRGEGPPESPQAAASLRLADWERLLVIEALRRTGGGVPEAATLLGVSRATLYRRLDAYGLNRDGPPPARP